MTSGAPETPPFSARRWLIFGGAAALIGAALWMIGLATDPRQAMASYLTAYAYVATLALGALAFLLITHAMGATWPVLVRRVVEAIAIPLPALALLFVPIALGLGELYPWATPHGGSHADDQLAHAIATKGAWLHRPTFVARGAGYLALWTAVTLLLWRWSVSQDREPAPGAGIKMRVLSAAAMPAVGLALTFASFDWLMSLTPGWASTMYGVYVFAGGFLGALALATAVSIRAAERGALPALTPSHLYALGRLLLTFTIFWAYAAFFQFFLIWIANKPTEVGWYIARQRGSWAAASVALALAQFVVPFFALLSYRIKRVPRPLFTIAVWLSVVHYLDVHWLVAPAFHPDAFRLHWLDLAALTAIGGITVAFAAWMLRGRPLVPVGDPSLAAALSYRSS